MKRRVVVTGIGAVTGLSCKVEDLWTRLLAGESGIGPITLWDVSKYKVRFAGEVRNWTTDGYVNPKDAKRIDRFTQFAMVAGMDAVRDSGLDFAKEDPFRCGAIIGSGIGGLNEIEEQHTRLLDKGPDRVSAFTIPKLMANAAAGHISIEYGLKGPSCAVATACASAANAIGDAFRVVRGGYADVMVTGGSEAALTPMSMAAFANMRALSERNDDPTRASRPWDQDRDGFVLSEGAGIRVLEELEHAKKRGAKIHGEVLGYGSTADAFRITDTHPEGRGAISCIKMALNDAGLNLDQIDYINAHGTSTEVNDKVETLAVKKVFGERAYKIPVSSTKSMMGHLIAAAGATELIVCLLAIRDKVLPPTMNYENPDPNCDLDYIPNKAREAKCEYALSNSFGFGGQNITLIASGFKN